MTVYQQIEDYKTQLASATEPAGQIKLLCALLNKFNAVASVDAGPYVDQLEKLAETSDEEVKGWALHYRGVLLKNQTKTEDALEILQRALVLFQACNAVSGQIATYINLGICYRVLSKHPEAITHQQKAIALAEQHDDKKSIALANNNLGNVYMHMGNYADALTCQLTALRVRRVMDDKVGLSASYRNVGNIYFKQKNYEQALVNYEESYRLSKQQGDQSGIAGSLCNLGVIHELSKRNEEAIACYKEAIAIYEEMKDNHSLSVVLHNIGIVYHITGNNEEADRCMTASLSISEAANQLYFSCYHRCYYAMFLKDVGRLEEALQQIQRAETEYKQVGSKDNLYNVYLTLSEIYEAMQQPAEALNAYKEYHRLHAEVLGKEATEQLTQLNFQHQSEQKEAVHKATEKILHNILPKTIAEKIKDGEEKIIQRFDSVSVLFADMVGFTVWSQKQSVDEVAETLNRLFNLFDELAIKYSVEKIKTIGDAYMCVSGLPEPCEDHAERMANMALAMLQGVGKDFPHGEIRLRIGIHTGEVIAGVLGKNKYAYDLWGDTVNTASRMESHGVGDKIQVSETFKRLLTDKFIFEKRGEMEIKGKGKMKTWFLSS